MPNPPIKITGSATMTIQRTSVRADELARFLERVPEDAELRIREHTGDQRDPGYTTIQASWDL